MVMALTCTSVVLAVVVSRVAVTWMGLPEVDSPPSSFRHR